MYDIQLKTSFVTSTQAIKGCEDEIHHESSSQNTLIKGHYEDESQTLQSQPSHFPREDELESVEFTCDAEGSSANEMHVSTYNKIKDTLFNAVLGTNTSNIEHTKLSTTHLTAPLPCQAYSKRQQYPMLKQHKLQCRTILRKHGRG